MGPGLFTISTPLSETAGVVDVAYNWYHSRMATISEGRVVTIWEEGSGDDDLWVERASWEIGGGQLNKLAWAHPEFGQVLAVGGENGSVSTWEEEAGSNPRAWLLRASLADSREPITALHFGPHQAGLLLAAASYDGWIRFYEPSTVLAAESWSLENELHVSHSGPVTSLSWRPHTTSLPPLILVGTSETAQVYFYERAFGRWRLSAELPTGGAKATTPTPGVDDVAWAPPLGRHTELVAVASGRQVGVWALKGGADALQGNKVATLEHPGGFWKVEWNLLGSWLAASTDDGQLLLYRPNLAGEWTLQKRICGKSADGPGDDDESME